MTENPSFAEREQARTYGLDQPLPEDVVQPKKRRLTIDEILDEVSAIAQDEGAGADRFRALKMLTTTQSATLALPEPLADGEVVDRLARVMKGAGAGLSQAAYQRAFPSARDATFAGGKMTYSDATPEMRQRANRITSLKLLYKHYPEAVVKGMPKGYPARRSNAMKSEWAQTQALKIEVERAIKVRKAGHEAMKAADAAVRPQATEGTDVPADPQGLPEPGV